MVYVLIVFVISKWLTRPTCSHAIKNSWKIVVPIYLYLYEVLGPGREDLSGQWSVWCSHLLKTMRWVYKKKVI